jgi:hypothetical protein
MGREEHAAQTRVLGSRVPGLSPGDTPPTLYPLAHTTSFSFAIRCKLSEYVCRVFHFLRHRARP